MSKIAVTKYTKKLTFYRIIPDFVDLDIRTEKITASTRKLTAKWSPIPSEQINYELSILKSVADDIIKDIDTQILFELTSKNP